jgi:DNA-binding MarR family transcriptional regulator
MTDPKEANPEGLKVSDSIAYQKFGEAAVGGFQVIPDILFKRQGELKISNVELVVILNILMHWWTPGQNPYPRPSTIAHRMNSSTRTTQRVISSLEDKKLLKRVVDANRIYLDPAPLVEKMIELVKSDEHYQYRKNKREQELQSVSAEDLP